MAGPLRRPGPTPRERKGAEMNADKPLLSLRGVSKRFGAVQALDNVDLEVAPGEVVGLVGDNGAGKSTLVKTIAGIYSPDDGEFYFDGQPVKIGGPNDATALGIATVYQDLALADNLDVVANLFLGSEIEAGGDRGVDRPGNETDQGGGPHPAAGKPPPTNPRRAGGIGVVTRAIDETTMERRSHELLENLAVTIPSVRSEVGTLSGGQRQQVAVARSLLGEPKLVLLDEPTAALGVAQTAQVLGLIKRLKERGLGVIVISHNLADVFEVTDRIFVLRLGKRAAGFDTGSASQEDVVAAITGATQAAATNGGTGGGAR